MNKPQPLFTIRTHCREQDTHTKVYSNYHELRCTQAPVGAEHVMDNSDGIEDSDFGVIVRFTRQGGRDQEYIFKIGVECMGDWNEILTQDEYDRRYRAVLDHEGPVEATAWDLQQNPRFSAFPAWGDTMASRALKIGNEAIEKFKALMALGIFDVGITL